MARKTKEENKRLTEGHKSWWESNTDVPYGYCWCGCGEKTPLARNTIAKNKQVKGLPNRYIKYHNSSIKRNIDSPTNAEEYKTWWAENYPDIPYGFCCCGCGQKTPIAKQTETRSKKVKGEPCLFVAKHNGYRPVAPEGPANTKRCSVCKKYLELTEYCKRNDRKDGLHNVCRKCRTDQHNKWEARNQEWLRLYQRSRRPIHITYYQKLRQAEGSHTVDELYQMYEDQDGLCAYCETSLNGLFHTDHMIPLGRKGTNDWGNLAISCGPCNLKKGTKTAEEFMNDC